MLAASVTSTQDIVTAAYDRAAPIYDAWSWQEFWTRNEVPRVRELVMERKPRPREAIDVGTGTGRYASVLTELGIRTTGVDTSSAMLRLARARLGWRARFVRADLLKIDLPQRFDCILGCRVLSHIASLPAALSKLTNVAADRAALVLTDLHPQHGYDRTRIEMSDGDLEIPTFKHHPEDIAAKLEHLGWRVDSHRDFRYGDLRWRPIEGFRSIDRSGVRPIFFILAASRVV